MRCRARRQRRGLEGRPPGGGRPVLPPVVFPTCLACVCNRGETVVEAMAMSPAFLLIAGMGEGLGRSAVRIEASAGPHDSQAGSRSAAVEGHLFILHADIRYLACDVWLLPVTHAMHIDEAHWQVPKVVHPPKPRGWGRRVKSVACTHKSESESQLRRRERFRTYSSPLPIVTFAIGDLSVDELMDALDQFLSLARIEAVESRFGRALPLVAVPIFGSGLASANVLQGDDYSGEIIIAMLDRLERFVKETSIDVALCTIDAATAGAAVNARRRRDGAYRRCAPGNAAVESIYSAHVTDLAAKFMDRRVALFFGAGVSVNAGLPSWRQLLDQLAECVGVTDADEREALSTLDPLEAAAVCAERAGGACALKELVARIIGGAKRFSVQHALLASLQGLGSAAITTNFDCLFEKAVRSVGGDLAVLPDEVGSVAESWLLKLHGSVESPPSIILTRGVRFGPPAAVEGPRPEAGARACGPLPPTGLFHLPQGAGG